LAFFAIIVIMVDLFIPKRGLLVWVSLTGLVVAAGFTLGMWGGNSQTIFNNTLAVDNFALFFKLLFLGIAALVILASVDYTSKF
ncbi:MAG: NADH-quinone oxidoreductase subunit N, partial [Phycisphaerae bacterium]|nr:NADH-quinone oxidoreductase subunit N [Phycisphaerae bacterium]